MRFCDPFFAAKYKAKQPYLSNGLKDDLVDLGIWSFHDQLLRCQAANNLLCYSIGTVGNLRGCLVLDWVGDKNSFKPRASQSACLNAGRSRELICSYGHRRDAKIFQPDRVVQTARCARSSISQSLHRRINPAQLLDYVVGSVFSKSRLPGPDDLGDLITLTKDFLQAVEKKASSAFADVKQSNALPGQCLQA